MQNNQTVVTRVTVTMTDIVPVKVYAILKKVVNEDIKNCSINLHEANKKGDGYLGEMCFVSLENKNNGKLYHLVVKQAFSNEVTRKLHPIRHVYLNEIYFYTKVWPLFQQFQREISPARPFDKIIKCFGATDEEGFEKLVFENIKYEQFQTMDKKKSFDKEHVEYIFKQYGKLHAFSFAYRALNPEKYNEISKGFHDVYGDFAENKTFQNGIKLIHEICLKSLQPGEDDEIIKKYKVYIENGVKAFADSNDYKGNYSVILHGDCWTNNLMFKYDDSGKLSDMRFLDFQISKNGNPVSDLAYCLYSGGSKEIFDELDYYLKVYHNSLLETVKEFGVNSENIYPFEVLRNDWKRHCQLGLTMAIFLWKAKLTNEDEILDLTDFDSEEDFSNDEKFKAITYDEVAFKKITRDIILHLYKNDFLVN